MLLTATQTAAFLGYSPDHFRRSWRGWRSRYGFPGPLIGLKWDQDALEAWRTARRDMVVSGPPEPPTRGRPTRADDETERRRAQRQVDRLARARAQQQCD